jgi:hypothetical protein
VQEDLAKFGCRPGMKIEKFRYPFIYWLPAGTYCRDLAILSFQNLANLRSFFYKSPSCVSKSYFQVTKIRNFEKPKKTK